MKKLSPALLKKMTLLALKARGNAYAPYSDHPVGAAILATGGKIYAGANCETAHYKGICAEASAISAMTLAGGRKINAIAVVGPSEKFLVTPCGDCRQRIREFSDLNVPIYSLWKDGTLGRVTSLGDLLPYSFGPDNVAELGYGPNIKSNKKKKSKNDKRSK